MPLNATLVFGYNYRVYAKAMTTAAVGYLGSKSGWLNKGTLGEVKVDLSDIFKKYNSPASFKVTKHVVKIDALSVSDTTKGSLIEANDANNTAVSVK